ncbi:Sugar transporter ERD6-like 5 [Bienertia sinuspersici]
MDRSGRRPLLMISAAGSCLGCFLTGLSFLSQDLHLWNSRAPILALVGVLIFPMNVKGLAGSLVTVVNWLGSWIISFSFNFLMNWSSSGTFFILISGSTVVFVALLVPETKWRTLEEIQESMNPLKSRR